MEQDFFPPAKATDESVVPGFRFHPTDEELVMYYLRNKACGKHFQVPILAEIDVYKYDPWDLPALSKTGDMEWYFFCPVDRNYGNSSPLNRASGSGYWKASGKDMCVSHKGETIGMKKKLVFHSGLAPVGLRTNWAMHEYKLVDINLQEAGVAQDAFVLCRVFKSCGLGPPNGDQDAPFFEEEQEYDVAFFVPGGEAEEDVATVSEGRAGGNDIEQQIFSMAPGFRFHPTDEELVMYYLRNKACGKHFLATILTEIDVYKYDPWHLPALAKTGDMEWYFLCPVDRNYGNRSPLNRASGSGYWKASGKDMCVRHKGETIGMKKKLVFHSGLAPVGLRTNWAMHEYKLVDINLQEAGVAQDAFVLCRIFKSCGLGPPNGDQDAPFFEEEQEYDIAFFVHGGEAEEDVATVSEGRAGGNDIEQQDLNLGAEQSQSTICLEVTSVEGNKPENKISFEVLSEHFGKSLEDAANSFHVSRSTFKRICRSHGIKRWQCGKSRMGIQSSSKLRRVNDKEPNRMNDVNSGIPPLQDIAVVAQTSQDMNKINVKATYNGVAIRFELNNSSGIAELEDNVIERLKLERDTFSIKYKDEEGDWVLIACDKDVQKCIEISTSLKETIVKMLVDLPVSRYAP